jgi:hypothetical protein
VIADDEAGLQFFYGPGWWEAATRGQNHALCDLRHCLSRGDLIVPSTRYCAHGDDAVHVFDYTAIGVLIASMIVAGALVLQRRKS